MSKPLTAALLADLIPLHGLREALREALVPYGRLRELNSDGAPESVSLDGYLGRLVPYMENMDIADLPPTTLITAPCDMSMRVAIELRQATGHPVALVEDGKLVGVCGDEEIYAGFLRQSSVADQPGDRPAKAGVTL